MMDNLILANNARSINLRIKSMRLSNRVSKIPKMHYAKLDPAYHVEDEQGVHDSYFLISGEETNLNGWGVVGSSIPKNIQTSIGLPFVITSTDFIPNSYYKEAYMHPNMNHFKKNLPHLVEGLDPDIYEDNLKFQIPYKVATIEKVLFNKELDLWQTMILREPQFATHPFPPFCSIAIFQDDKTEPEDKMTKWRVVHHCGLTESPAYGDQAIYNGRCNGTLASCTFQFADAKTQADTDLALAKGTIRTAKAFDESEHPRDGNNQKFTKGGSGGKGPQPPTQDEVDKAAAIMEKRLKEFDELPDETPKEIKPEQKEKDFPQKDLDDVKIFAKTLDREIFDVTESIGDDGMETMLKDVHLSGTDPGTKQDAILSSGHTVIQADSMPAYMAANRKLIDSSPKLQEVENKINDFNKKVQDTLDKNETVYRGMKINELNAIAENDGKVGLHKREKYGAKDDFLSTSVSSEAATRFLEDMGLDNVVVEFDVSGIRDSTQPVEYQLRKDVRVNVDGDDMYNVPRNTYRPGEHYGGSHPGQFMREAEVHLKKGSIPKISAITVPKGFATGTGFTDEGKSNFKKYVNAIEKQTGNPITINYEGGMKESMTESKSETNEESQIKHVMQFLEIDRQTAVREIRRWA